MSVPSAWRQFQLFDFLAIRDPELGSGSPLFSDASLSAITVSKSYLVFCANNVYVSILNKQFELVRQFCAYDDDYRVNFARPLLHSNLLVTVAEKQDAPSVVKVWDLSKMAHMDNLEEARHKYVTQVVVHDGDSLFPISCMLFNESLTCIALGYTNGRVILIRGDLLRDRGAKQRVVYENVDPVTSIHFNRFEDLLYVTTTSKIVTVLTTGRNQGKAHRVLSNTGADLECADMDFRSLRLIVASPEGFKYYNHVSRAHVVTFSVPKRKILRIFKDYLLVVCPLEEAAGKLVTRLLVLDLVNVHVAFSLTIPNSTISHVFSLAADGNVYLLATDGVLYQLHEKPINQQIEIVLQKQLYSVAFNLATQYRLDSATLYRINRLHGDNLYKTHDYDAAIEKYIECLPLIAEDAVDDFVIGVITDFKESSNILNMSRFLASLYQHELADSDHVTLLMCCYCKLKNVEELDKFVAALNLDAAPKKLNLNNVNFSLLVNIFKECGYYAQAMALLLKLNNPRAIVDIQLNELQQHQKCMVYIKSLPVDDLLRILIDYLKDLLDCMPMETCELLINVFTGKYKPVATEAEFDDEKSVHGDQPQEKPSSYAAFLAYLGYGPDEERENEEPTYLPPRPSLVFPCFINHNKEFVVFLEACIKTFDKYQGNPQDKKEMLMTLFDMYLTMSQEERERAGEWRGKAKRLLREHGSLFDKSSVMLISNMHNFPEGEVMAKEAVGGFEEAMFLSAQTAGDVARCFELVRKYGETRPNLYKMMLKFGVLSQEILRDISSQQFRQLLELIQRHGVATPLEVIGIMSANECATVGLVSDYLISHVALMEKEISNNEKLIQLYESEATKSSVEMLELAADPTLVKATMCSSCELKLEFPIIYFKCKHSYHQRCLEENTFFPEGSQVSCPMCVNDLQLAETTRDAQLHLKERIDLFDAQMADTTDRLRVVTEYFGKGIMEV